VFLFFGLFSCGTILKPYQINKPHSNNFDISVVALDSIGLIFVFPGIIALFVDYTNGTIYLPK
jgi:hypothetical protein